MFWPQKFFQVFFPHLNFRSLRLTFAPSFAKIVSTSVRYLLERWSASTWESLKQLHVLGPVTAGGSMNFGICSFKFSTMKVRIYGFLRNIKKSGLSSDCWWNKNPAHVNVVNIPLLQGFCYIPGGCLGFLPSAVSMATYYWSIWWFGFEFRVLRSDFHCYSGGGDFVLPGVEEYQKLHSDMQVWNIQNLKESVVSEELIHRQIWAYFWKLRRTNLQTELTDL